MAQYGVGEGRAFEVLVRGSADTQRTLRAVAAADRTQVKGVGPADDEPHRPRSIVRVGVRLCGRV